MPEDKIIENATLPKKRVSPFEVEPIDEVNEPKKIEKKTKTSTTSKKEVAKKPTTQTSKKATTTSWLFPLGLTTDTFFSSDYFPLLPQLGYFLLGIGIGRMAYREKKTRLPGSFSESTIARFFRFCGRHSLLIYLVHQPVLYGVTELAMKVLQ